MARSDIATSPEPVRVPLTRERIVTAAVAIADTDGVAKLSMRSLARDLGFEVMSLYNHVDNKNQLLSLMVDAVAAEIDTPTDSTAALEVIRTIAITMHDVLVRHPWAPQLWVRVVPGPARTALMEDLLRLFDHSGLSPDLAHHGFHAVTNHVIGYTMQELGMELDRDDAQDRIVDFMTGLSEAETPYMIAHVQQHLDGDTSSSFELVLDLILDGLVRLDQNC
jgi:AcrR family transcriptional regulator